MVGFVDISLQVIGLSPGLEQKMIFMCHYQIGILIPQVNVVEMILILSLHLQLLAITSMAPSLLELAPLQFSFKI